MPFPARHKDLRTAPFPSGYNGAKVYSWPDVEKSRVQNREGRVKQIEIGICESDQKIEQKDGNNKYSIQLWDEPELGQFMGVRNALGAWNLERNGSTMLSCSWDKTQSEVAAEMFNHRCATEKIWRWWGKITQKKKKIRCHYLMNDKYLTANETAVPRWLTNAASLLVHYYTGADGDALVIPT